MRVTSACPDIATENERDGSPLKGKIATDRMCVTGQSMGGGGTLWAATDYKVYLEDDMRYLDVLNAPMDPALSMYLKPK